MGLFSKVLKPITNLVSDVVGGTMNAVTGVSDTAKQSYNQSLALMDKENANNIKLWNMQNEYNTPAAQIARMKEAGVDVNPMTYAVGNGNMSTTAGSISSATPHMPSYSGAGNPITSLLSVLGGIKDLEYKQKMIDNYEHDHASPYKDLADAIRSLAPHIPRAFRHMSENYGEGYARKHMPQVYDSSKPALGSNLKSVPDDWKFTWWPW